MNTGILHEHILDLDGIVEWVSRGRPGKPIHKSTAIRWMDPGIGGITLEHARLGRSLVSSVEAIVRFSEALATARQQRAASQPTSRLGQSRRQREIEAAERRIVSKRIIPA